MWVILFCRATLFAHSHFEDVSPRIHTPIRRRGKQKKMVYTYYMNMEKKRVDVVTKNWIHLYLIAILHYGWFYIISLCFFFLFLQTYYNIYIFIISRARILLLLVVVFHTANDDFFATSISNGEMWPRSHGCLFKIATFANATVYLGEWFGSIVCSFFFGWECKSHVTLRYFLIFFLLLFIFGKKKSRMEYSVTCSGVCFWEATFRIGCVFLCGCGTPFGFK